MPPFQTVSDPHQRTATRLLLAAILIAGLYAGRGFLAPLALALLLTIAALPVVDWLERHRVPRLVAVASALLVLLAVIGTVLYVVVTEAYSLAAALPSYEHELRSKLAALGTGAGPLDAAWATLHRLGNAAQPAAVTVPLQQVRIAPDPETPLAVIAEVLKLVLTPAAIVAVTLLLMAFLLAKREDVRDRVLRLAGTEDLHRTTMAMQEATNRVGRFLLMQLGVNAVFGLLMGGGLAVLGVGNAPLWGVLAFALRFIPFLGAPLSMLFPAIVAFATTDGWTTVLLVLAWFAVVDVLITYVMEPLIYGTSTGVSPLALVLSSIFWAALWGPVGLILAPAICASLVSLGRAIPGLAFLDVTLGDRPPLSPAERFYQRLLAGDSFGAARLLEDEAEDSDESQALSDLAEPALQRIGEGRRMEDFSTAMMLRATRTLMTAIGTPSEAPASEVLVLPVGGALDQAAARMAAVALHGAGHDAGVGEAGAGRLKLAVVAVTSQGSPARLQRAIRQARQRAADVMLFAPLPYAPAGLPGITVVTTLEQLLEAASSVLDTEEPEKAEMAG